ncbi:endo-1,4-beta-xylanase [Patulibacter sp. NPDC049589]|uniref:endo-1,4-beta-xylanase n=1 Tax=Patulibacter sp. NPDC049589 TaxID=3154731 RepID=UPI00343FB945
MVALKPGEPVKNSGEDTPPSTGYGSWSDGGRFRQIGDADGSAGGPSTFAGRSIRTMLISMLLCVVAAMSLATVAEARKVPLGAAMDWAKLSPNTPDAAAYRNAFQQNYGVLVPENEMKMNALWTSMPIMIGDTVLSTGINYATMDKIASYAAQNNKKLRGHTLVFCSTNGQGEPPWLPLFNVLFPNGQTRTDMLRKFLRVYIHDVVLRYKTQVTSWDVTNEFFVDPTPGSPNNGDGKQRPCFWTNELGESVIADAFRWAREADSTAKLYANEAGLDDENDASRYGRSRILALRSQGVPIDGIGLQMHLDTNSLAGHTQSIMQPYFTSYTSRGVSVMVTEMDVRYAIPTSSYVSSTGQALAQRDLYANIASACQNDVGCTGFNTWGVGDKYTWRDAFVPAGGPNHEWPLPFTVGWQPKDAWAQICSRLCQ